jgi:predicted dehydrogenase
MSAHNSNHYQAVFYQPGHFHAALTLRSPSPRLAEDVHLYATPGPECDAFVSLVESFNQRAQQPTRWRLHLHDGNTDDDLLQQLIDDANGDFVVFAGQNNQKLKTTARLVNAGWHVLADKPWLTDSSQLSYLDQALAGPPLAMDIMTIRHEILARLSHQVVNSPQLFGEFVSGDPAVPAIEVGSIHHLYKMVNNRPLRRPPWYYDIKVQGDGLVDIQSHMVEQAQWWVLGEDSCDYQRDIVLDGARRWTTPVPPELFRDSTGLDQYPEAMRDVVHDGVLQFACNGEIRYRLRGVGVVQTAEWRQREPQGAGDMHRVLIRGSRCQLQVRQGPETSYRAEVHLQPVGANAGFEATLKHAIEHWQERFPGLSYQPSDIGFHLLAPADLDCGHESHFPLVLNQFLDYLDHGHWPEALTARIRSRYLLLAAARELVLQNA